MVELSKHEAKELRRQEKLREELERTEAFVQKKTKKKLITYSVTFLIIAIVVIGGYTYLRKQESEPGHYDTFAQCLTAKGAIMAGAYWCPHCAAQKQLFGKSFKYVTYKECDPNGKDADPDFCLQHNVKSYPTWLMGNATYTGEVSLEKLAEYSGCSLV